MINDIFELKDIVYNMDNPLACFKIISNENNQPIDYKFIFLNKAFENLINIKNENVVSKKVSEVLSNVNWISEFIEGVILGLEREKECYFHNVEKWFKINAYTTNKGYLIMLLSDITKYKKLYLEIKEKEELLRQITENLEEAIILQDIKTKEVIYISPAYEKIHDVLIEDELNNKGVWRSSVHPDDIERVKKEFTMENALKEIKEKGFFISTYRIFDKEGKHEWIQSKYIPIKDEKGEIVKVLGIDQDITRLKIIEEELIREKEKTEKIAMLDYLTGIYNRRAFYIKIEEEIERAKRTSMNLSFIMADLDNFKKINDNLGHNIGDEILKHFVSSVLQNIRGYDFVARYGGEEFIIAVHGNYEQAISIAERIRQHIEISEFKFDDNILKYTVSFGVSTFKVEDNYDVEEVIKRADKALYISKKKGKNQVNGYI